MAPDWTVAAWSAAAARSTALPADRVVGGSIWIAFPAAKGTELELGALRRREGDPDAPTHHAVRRQRGAPRRRRRPCGDGPVGRHGQNTDVETVEQLFRVHACAPLVPTNRLSFASTRVGSSPFRCQAARGDASTQHLPKAGG